MSSAATIPDAAITGTELIAWGHKPGPKFPALLERAKVAQASGLGLADIRAMLTADLPRPGSEPLALQTQAIWPFISISAPRMRMSRTILKESWKPWPQLCARPPSRRARSCLTPALQGPSARYLLAEWWQPVMQSIRACIPPISAVR